MQAALTEEQAYDVIIWSADVSDIGEMESWLDQMPYLRWVKVDRFFVDENGWEVFEMLRERGLNSFDDSKMVEIPEKIEKIARTHCRKAKPTMLNCMAGGISNGSFVIPDPKSGFDGLKRFADVCLEAEVLPCGVTVLTSKTPEVIAEEFGYPDQPQTAIDQVLWYTEALVEAGFNNMVSSPQEAGEVVSRFGNAISPNTPGVRPAGSTVGDQARVDTPLGAVRRGSKRLVIGRPLTQGSGTPAENLQTIVDELTLST